MLGRLNDAINGGKTIAEAFARERPDISDLEIGVVAAGEKSGRLDSGTAHLAEYFGALATARESLFKKLVYPVFVLHFGVFMLALPKLFFGGGLASYLRATLGFFALVYGVLIIILLLVPILRDAGSRMAAIDRLLRFLPLLGKTRRAFATARFCATYGMQLDAGINVLDALQAAQRASRSGLVREAVAKALPEVRGGVQVGPLLAASGAFPEPMTRALCIGEQTGELDTELARLAADYQAEGVSRLETATEWLARAFHIAILLYVGYIIVTGYKAYLDKALSFSEGL
jgi:type II secretory pathway component PulF